MKLLVASQNCRGPNDHWGAELHIGEGRRQRPPQKYINRHPCKRSSLSNSSFVSNGSNDSTGSVGAVDGGMTIAAVDGRGDVTGYEEKTQSCFLCYKWLIDYVHFTIIYIDFSGRISNVKTSVQSMLCHRSRNMHGASRATVDFYISGTGWTIAFKLGGWVVIQLPEWR